MKNILAALFILAFSATAMAAGIESPVVPDQKLTPGAVLTTDASKVCKPGYAKTVRHTAGSVKRAVYLEYGITTHKSGQYEIDHLISLELGGADIKENLWPQFYEEGAPNDIPTALLDLGAHAKDKLENFLHAAVCHGEMPLEQAQKEISTDWIGAYKKYIGI